MPEASRRGVFLSYRRDDAGPYARSLQLQLSQSIPDAPIFMDLDSIEPGLDFAEVIEHAVKSSAVLVALIGRQWTTLTDEDGVRRLDNLDDYVRFELKTALERGLRVIPVLVDGARPVRQQDLPADLHKLARLNALKLSYDRYQDDASHLLDQIQRLLGSTDVVAEADHQPVEQSAHRAREGTYAKDRTEPTREAETPAELRRRARRAQSAGDAGDAAGARDQFAALLAIRERVSGPEDPDTLLTRQDLAGWTGFAGNAAGARDQIAALLPLAERIFGPEDPHTLTIRNDLAHWTTAAGGDPAVARDQFAALLAIRERVSGPEDPGTIVVRYNVARYTGEAGDAAGARDQMAALLPLAERIFGPEDPYTLTIRNALACWTGEAGNPAEARDQYAALLPLYERVLGSEHSYVLAAEDQLKYWTGRARGRRSGN